MAFPVPPRWLVLLGLVLPVTPARAQDGTFELGATPVVTMPPPLTTSYFEAGTGYQDINSFHFSRYGGPTKRGPFAVFRGALDGGDAWDSKGARSWNGAVDVFGFDTTAARIRYGTQGSWRAGAFYEGFTRSYTNSARTPYNGSGGTVLSLPSNWASSNTSAGFSALAQNLHPLDLKVDWRTVGGDIVVTPREGYEIRMSASHRDREGLRGQSLAFGHEMNTAVGVFFAQPVDYQTDQASASLAFTGDRLQWSASYNLSVFTNDLTSVRVPNPYNRALGGLWPGGALSGYPNAFGEYGLPPSSIAHQALLSGAYSVSPKVRLTARVSYMVQKQDEAFLPYTAMTQLSVPEPLPRTSLDGKVYKAHVVLGVTARPSPTVDVSAGYTFDDRDNRSPIDLYSYVANEAQDQIRPLVPGASRYIRYNLPHSFTFQQAKADVGVRVAPRTRLTISYVGDFRARKYQQVSDTSEHTFRAKLLTTFTAGSAWLAYAYASRSGSIYDDALPWDLSHTESYLNASPFNQSIEHPLLRKFNMADRKRNEVKGGATFELSPALMLDATSFYAEDDYKNSPLGLQRSETVQLDANLSYVLAKQLTTTAFYSFERIKFDLTGYLMGTVNLTNSAQNWSTANRDIIHTAGAKVDWDAISQLLKVTAGYYVSDGASHTNSIGSNFALVMNTSPLPDARDVTHNVNLTGDYKVRTDTTLRVGYTFQHHTTNDWQYGYGAATVPQILGSGIVPPRYSAHLVWLSARYDF
ncbi:MAG: MtrB/PioB family decaheme-associated outer membrane protein [Rhodospirillaceae bacterium]